MLCQCLNVISDPHLLKMIVYSADLQPRGQRGGVKTVITLDLFEHALRFRRTQRVTVLSKRMDINGVAGGVLMKILGIWSIRADVCERLHHLRQLFFIWDP